MAWRIEFSAEASRELGRVDPQHGKRIVKFLQERVAKLDDPRRIGKALQGSRLGEFWRYRIGPFRLICKIEDNRLLVLVLRIGDRKEVYR